MSVATAYSDGRRRNEWHLVGRGEQLCKQLALAVPDVDDAIVASCEDYPRVRRRGQGQHCFVRVSDLFLVAAARTLLAGVRLEIRVRGNVATIRGRDDHVSVAGPGEGRHAG